MERAAMKRAAIDRAASCALSRRTHEQVSSHCGRCMKRGRSLGFKVTGGGSDSKGHWLAQGRLWDLGEPLWGTRNRSTSNLTRSRCEGAPPVRVAFWVGTGWVGHRPPPPWRGVAPAPPSGLRGRVLILLLYLFYRVLYWLFYWVRPLIKSVDNVSQTQPYV